VLGAEIFTRYRLTVRGVPHPGARATPVSRSPVPVSQAAARGELS
jgi:hypothetical protein